MSLFSHISQSVELLTREDTCSSGNDYNGEHFGARISSVFVVLIASAFGAYFPVLSSRYSFIRMPPACFFIAKFFGSGVIIATAFIHLLEPASDNLSNDCLGYPFDVYPFAFGICLIVLMLMFFLELIAYRWIEAKVSNQNIDDETPHTHSHFGDTAMYTNEDKAIEEDIDTDNNHSHSHHHHHHHMNNDDTYSNDEMDHLHSEFQNDDECIDDQKECLDENLQVVHFNEGHSHTHTVHNHTESHLHDHELGSDYSITKDFDQKVGLDSVSSIDLESQDAESLATYTAQLLNVFILEFGIIFHSVFVGLTLACSGDEFTSLYIVVCFHQLFEGLGLGTRVACVNWPKSKRWTPWLLCLGYTISTPIAIAIGIGIRNSYPPGSRRALITNGVFDSISAGILIYTGCVELMAHEFLFSDEFKGKGGFKKMIYAYLVMCVGAGLMALLGRWA